MSIVLKIKSFALESSRRKYSTTVTLYIITISIPVGLSNLYTIDIKNTDELSTSIVVYIVYKPISL